jgi:trans-2,3-dihydro-3-hydroxyanthranilate isomerase
VGESGVSAFAVEDGKVKTRMFAPGLGVVEDAATGGAAGPIAVHLARNGVVEWEAIVEIEQGAEIGRPSFLYAWAFGDADAVTAVDVGGSALVVARGEFGV